MKKILTTLFVAGLLACMVLVGGCSNGGDGGGDGGAGGATGYAVKGAVSGATLTYSDGNSVLTAADGSFPCNLNLSVTTTGGIYRDIDGHVRKAPDMAAPAGVCNVTVLTTLYANADPATKTALEALVSPAKIDDIALGTITSENELVAKLNESLGEVLTQITEAGATPSSAYLAGLATQVAELTPATALSSANIVAAINENTVPVPSGVVINTDAVVTIADATTEGADVSSVPPVNNPVTINVAAGNVAPYDASPTAVTFTVHPTTTFTYNVANFAANDKLVFDTGTALGVTNTSGTDGVIDVVGSLNGHAVTVHLTGIAEGTDSQVTGVNGFKTAFGSGSLVLASSGPTVEASTSNAAPYDASTAAIVFNVHPTTTFTYNVANFAAGDKLVFDNGTALGVTNTSGTDGVIDVDGSLNGQVATVHLTGIAAVSDGAIFGVNSFNTVFGSGSLQ